MGQPSRRAPLAGVRVIEFSQYVAGPLAGRMLSDLGAEVIKMEFAPRGDLVRYYPPLRAGVSVGTLAYNRGKRSVCVDVKKPEGARLAVDLICRSDVMVENFSPGVLAKYGLGYEQLSRRDPRIIVCSITGYGQACPLGPQTRQRRDRPVSSGLLHLIGDPDGKPAIPAMTMGDCSGGIHGFGAVCAALYMREKTGEGQYIDLSLDECLAHLLDNFYVMYQITGGKVVPKRTGSHHPSVSPMGVFRARDGYITLACMIDQWPLFTSLIGQCLAEKPTTRASMHDGGTGSETAEAVNAVVEQRSESFSAATRRWIFWIETTSSARRCSTCPRRWRPRRCAGAARWEIFISTR